MPTSLLNGAILKPDGGSSRREIVARLAEAQKSSRGAAGYSRWINRRAGRQIAAVAYVASLTPNQVTAISGVFTFAGVASIAVFKPAWPATVAIVIALLLGYAFDSADGQLARLRGGGSYQGEWLDHVVDALKMSVFHLFIVIMWFRYFHFAHASMLLIPLAFSGISATFYFAIVLSDVLRRVARATAGGTAVTTASVNPNEAAPVLRSLVVLPNDYGVLCLAVVLTPLHAAFVMVYVVLLAANGLFLVAGSVRWFREMGQLSAGR